MTENMFTDRRNRLATMVIRLRFLIGVCLLAGS